jgi:hypothetical protein
MRVKTIFFLEIKKNLRTSHVQSVKKLERLSVIFLPYLEFEGQGVEPNPKPGADPMKTAVS